MNKYLRITLGAVFVIAIVGTFIFYSVADGWFAEHRGAGDVLKTRLPAQIIAQKQSAQKRSQRATRSTSKKQILFGDFHVHTTFSLDAFLLSLPMLRGKGAHPPADACDFARFCSNLDFWSINDHAEGISPENWQDTRRSIQQCDEVAGDENNKDLVSFLGWEWTQVGTKPKNHYGHKNVIIRDVAQDKTPARAISSAPPEGSAVGGLRSLIAQRSRIASFYLAIAAPGGMRSDYLELNRFFQEITDADACPKGVNVRELPQDCFESTQTPKELFAKLDEWNLPSIVIPHGTTWGFYTPGGSTFDKQLTTQDPKRQTLIEVFSGHGNSEQYFDFRATRFDAQGKASCPKPHNNYLPSCWQAGEIIRKRCRAEGIGQSTCDKRAETAKQNYVDHGQVGWLTVAGGHPDDWLDSGQCRDCILPAFNYRPGGSVQYILALTDFTKGQKKRFRFGFIAASDNHNAQPGTGYKEFARHDMTEVSGTDILGSVFDPEQLRGPGPFSSEPADPAEARKTRSGFTLFETERNGSFFTTGGLVAVHSAARSRGAVWDALDRREVYGTSGDRILLWFDLQNAPKGKLPMGSEVVMSQAPSFTVRVAGAFKQKPGCPPHALQALGQERIDTLCLGECYNPSATRKKITHVDVIRILPQDKPGENITRLIKDPWKRLPCNDRGQGCVVKFSDPEFARLKRDAVYYVRAHQEPTPVVNGDNLRCTYDKNGKCIKVKPCYGDYRVERGDNCLAKKPEMAWSSPIYVDYGQSRAAAAVR